MNLELFIAKRLSRSKKIKKHYTNTITNLSKLVLSICIAVMLLCVAISKGLQSTISKTLINTNSEISINHINKNNLNKLIDTKEVDFGKIKEIEGIKNIENIILTPVLIKNEKNLEGLIIKGVEDNYKDGIINHFMKSKNELESLESNELIISANQSQSLNLKSGDSCFLYFISANKNILKRKFTVKSIFESKNTFFDKNYAFTKINTLRDINNYEENLISTIEISLNEDIEIKKTSEKINELLKYDLVATSINERFPGLFSWINLFDKNIFFLITVLLFICLFNITNTMLIIVFHQTQTVGILKSFGMKNFSIIKIFMIQKMEIFLHSFFFGNLISIFFFIVQSKTNFIKLNPNSYFIDYVPVEFNLPMLIAVNLLTLLIIQISIFVPYLMVRKITPSNILKID